MLLDRLAIHILSKRYTTYSLSLCIVHLYNKAQYNAFKWGAYKGDPVLH